MNIIRDTIKRLKLISSPTRVLFIGSTFATVVIANVQSLQHGADQGAKVIVFFASMNLALAAARIGIHDWMAFRFYNRESVFKTKTMSLYWIWLACISAVVYYYNLVDLLALLAVCLQSFVQSFWRARHSENLSMMSDVSFTNVLALFVFTSLDLAFDPAIYAAIVLAHCLLTISFRSAFPESKTRQSNYTDSSIPLITSNVLQNLVRNIPLFIASQVLSTSNIILYRNLAAAVSVALIARKVWFHSRFKLLKEVYNPSTNLNVLVPLALCFILSLIFVDGTAQKICIVIAGLLLNTFIISFGPIFMRARATGMAWFLVVSFLCRIFGYCIGVAVLTQSGYVSVFSMLVLGWVCETIMVVNLVRRLQQ